MSQKLMEKKSKSINVKKKTCDFYLYSYILDRKTKVNKSLEEDQNINHK